MVIFIWIHLFAAVTAVSLGVFNLAAKKGTKRHRKIGWLWIIFMVYVTLSSFWIREVNDGKFSWLHFLSALTILKIILGVALIKKGHVKGHARFMIGTMIGIFIAGTFALMPERYIAAVLGY